MQQEKLKKKTKPGNYGFTMLPNNFLKEWTQTLGKGPTLLYLQLYTYCHKDKKIAWPTLKTLGDDLGMSKTSLVSYQKILLNYGLIKKVGRRNTQGNYQSNLYHITSIESAKNEPGHDQKLNQPGTEIELYHDPKLNPNNNNLNNNNITTTRDVVVNFKKEKGEEKMQEIRERMREFDFTESFTEKVLKEFPLKKVEEKLELYAEGKLVRNPVGWLMSALKKDYQEEVEKNIEESPFQLKMDSRKCGNDIEKSGNEDKKILSREEAIKRIQEIRKNLMVMGNTNCQLERRKR